ncbi:UDP-glucosyltransferase 2-like [Neocloeon triangulifer]|uniref:UDP-glucosyltransferase 2-like n=1 Tax=Neocloeon triangulifer TaxID=2078957 RepID=UPI00286EF39A|nr:UDP-glucosyltransferase 2-like [Neocloeon triangulifer]
MTSRNNRTRQPSRGCKMTRALVLPFLPLMFATFAGGVGGKSILMVTMGGTKSHTVPFAALSRALAARGHNITMMSAFPGVAEDAGAEELCPDGLVGYVKDFTKDWDLLGSRMHGEPPISPWRALQYGYQVCEATLSDPEMQQFMRSGRVFDLLVLDGAYSACALGLVHHFSAPYMLINTVGLYLAPLAALGNPEPFAITPFFNSGYTENMNILQRMANGAVHLFCRSLHWILISTTIQPTLNRLLGPGVPSVLTMQRNASFVLQNGHSSLTYSRAYLPHVAEVACLHCRPPRPLPQDLERFVSESGPEGTIVVSMGSSVKAAAMPAALRRVFVAAFAKLRQRVIWKWEHGYNSSFPENLPANVHLVQWLPQQDLLGHPKVVALVSHGGLLSMFEAAYHAKPVIMLPVFCDHDANAAKAAADGYAIKIELQGITADLLAAAINKVIKDPRYRQKAELHSSYLHDQPITPLKSAVYWTEYILRHRGAPEHLQGAAMRDLSVIQWLYLDVLALLLIAFCAIRRIAALISKSASCVNCIAKKLKQH